MTEKKTKTKFSFKDAVQKIEHLRDHYQTGLKALGQHSIKVQLSQTRECQGSVNIDEGLQAIYPQAHRWDCALGYRSEVFFVEVHPASTSEVGRVLSKLDWLKGWLATNAPELEQIKAKKGPFIWLQTNRYSILRTSPQARRLAQAGLRLTSKLVL